MKKKIEVEGKKVYCYLVDEETGEVFEGVATCSEKDEFIFEKGAEIAAQRAFIESKKHENDLLFNEWYELTRKIYAIQSQRGKNENEIIGRSKRLAELIN